MDPLDWTRHLEGAALSDELQVTNASLDYYADKIRRLEMDIEAGQALLKELGDPHGSQHWDLNDPRWEVRFELQNEVQRLSNRSCNLKAETARKQKQADEIRRLLSLSFLERVAEERLRRLAEARNILERETRERFGPPTRANLRRCWFLLRCSCQYQNLFRLLEDEPGEPPAVILNDLIDAKPDSFALI